MTFTYYDADLTEIIKKYERENNNYKIEYMDGSVSNYICSSDVEIQRIKERMINQAIQRDIKIDLNRVKTSKYTNLLVSIFSFMCTSILVGRNEYILTLITILFGLLNINRFIQRSKMILELKKYKMFLSMLDDIDSINNCGILKCIEFDSIYQKPLDIDTLDEYTYFDVKTIYKKYKTKNNK